MNKPAVSRWTMRLWCLGLLLLGLQAAGLDVPRAEHVLLVSLDGLGSLPLRAHMAAAESSVPNLRRLLREGSGTLNARCDYHSSETVPNHTCMLLGRPLFAPADWPADSYHGYNNNGYTLMESYHTHGNTNAGYLASVWDVVHDHGGRTACLVSKSKLLICANSYNATNGAPDTVGEDNGRNKVDYVQNVEWSLWGNNRWTLLAAVTNYLQDEAPRFAFIHFADLDYTGHYYGWGSSAWSNVLEELDVCLGRLLAVIENHPQMQQRTAMILTADHGGGVPFNSHIDPVHAPNYTIPFIVWGPGWPAGRDLYHLCRNRGDPEGYRVADTAALPPLRNGDAANLALDILGLPPVPGSSLRVEWGTPAIGLSVMLEGGKTVVRWPAPAGGFRLETATNVQGTMVWEPVIEGVSVDEVGWWKTLELTPASQGVMQLFRLRRE